MNHFNIATEGIRVGRSLFVKLGIGYVVPTTIGRSLFVKLGIGYVVPTTIGSTSGNYSLVPFPMQYDRREKQRLIDPLYSLINVIFNGKEENFLFNSIYDLFDTRIEIRLVKKKKKDIEIKVQLEGITISSPIINVRSKNDSSK